MKVSSALIARKWKIRERQAESKKCGSKRGGSHGYRLEYAGADGFVAQLSVPTEAGAVVVVTESAPVPVPKNKYKQVQEASNPFPI